MCNPPSPSPPPLPALPLQSDNGAKLAFSDYRRLGRLRLASGDPFAQPPLSELGSDALDAPLTLELFAAGACTCTL